MSSSGAVATGEQRYLRCIDDNLESREWRECLIQVDHLLMKVLDEAADDGVVVLSLPYGKSAIKESMEQVMRAELDQHSSAFCCDAVIEFLAPNCSNINFDNELETASLIVFNSKNGYFVSVPRDQSFLQLAWEITWDANAKDNLVLNAVGEHIAVQCFPSHFEYSPDWAKRTDFWDGVEQERYIGYVADDGVVVRGDLLRVNTARTKIFVHFNQDITHFNGGEKWRWLPIPNDRVRPPPETRPPPGPYRAQGAASASLSDTRRGPYDGQT